MIGPPVLCYRPVLLRAVHHYVSSTLPLYLALMRFIAPNQSTARARLLTALIFLVRVLVSVFTNLTSPVFRLFVLVTYA